MDNFHLEIDGLQVEILPKAIKNMYLRIYPPNAQVQVSVPHSFSLQEIRQQIKEKRKWIDKKRTHILSLPAPHQYKMESGEMHYFLGKAYRLEVYETQKLLQPQLNQNVLQIYVKPNMSVTERKKLLASWYRTQMQELLPSLISKWETIIGVRVKQWGIKQMKTRWGTCNIRAQRIWLNLELIKKPLACLESVLVHELVHLLEKNHNARFYNFMNKFMPEWKLYQNDLKDDTINALF